MNLALDVVPGMTNIGGTMKIGILTFHYTNNVGSILQTYALQRVVRSMEIECDVVNYQVKDWMRIQYEPLIRKRVHFFWPLAMPVILLMIDFGKSM